MEFDEYAAARSAELLRLSFVLTGDHHAAQDLTQATLAKAFTSWSALNNARDPDAYLRKICVNKYLSWRRRMASREIVTADPLGDGSDHAPATEDAAERIDLQRLLGRLPPRARAVLVLRYYLDLSTDDIASLIGSKPATVRSLISRGLVAARALLVEDEPAQDRKETGDAHRR